jgi:EAL domain-containing protein (putative c-di-GMP-specific phosphodiesterase class I)
MRETPRAAALVTETSIREILSGDRVISLVAQPIVDLRRGVITGYEALARFGLDRPVTPDVVFDCAEQFGLGAELETLVIRRALELAYAMPPNCFLAINVDPMHLTHASVFDLLVQHDSLEGLVLELTEHRPTSGIQNLAGCLSELRKRGAMIAVDDAGAGYAGLAQILALRPQFVKVDQALVTGVHLDEAKRAMIQMLGELAGRLDAWLVAEGIENHADLHALAQLGVPLGQGNLLARATAPWSRLVPGVERILRSLPQSARGADNVRDLVEPCMSCDVQSPWPEAPSICVRLEASGRPVGLRVVDENGERERSAHELLRVKRDSALAAVALRSAARSERLRWDPIVCIDELGHFQGVITVHKLIWALASRESGEREAGWHDSEIRQAVAEQL